jgi:transposase
MRQWQQAAHSGGNFKRMAGGSFERTVMKAMAPAQIWLAVEPVDMRAGIDGLSTRVQEALGKSPCDGAAYVFRNRRRDRIKLLMWDSTGVWLCQRRLHQGSFVWPDGDTAICELSEEQWNWLTAGVDWQRLSSKKPSGWSF